MASWNNNFAYSSNMARGVDGNLHYPPLTQPPPLHLPPPLPVFRASPQSSFPKPPPVGIAPPFPFHAQIPPLVSPPFPTSLPPPICNTALPPPPIPPSTHSVSSLSFKDNLLVNPEEKFNRLISQIKSRLQLSEINKKPTSLKVSDIKEKLVSCFSYIEKLESLVNCLQLTFKSLPEDEWSGLCGNALRIKREVDEELKEIVDPDILKEMKEVIKLRMKKRNYRKRKLQEWKEKKRVAKIHRDQENRRIDLWLEKMKDQVARAKREEDIKREADIVLADVTAKKAEAKRLLNFLNSLAKLRTARAHNQSEKSDSEEGNKAFNEIIDHLKKMWLDQFNGYKVEEEGLKVMLGHAEEERASIEAAQLRRNLKAWQQVIFGTSSSAQPENIEELIRTRHDWDKFICSEDAPMASSIPVGWVLPSEPSSKDWEKLLQLP